MTITDLACLVAKVLIGAFLGLMVLAVFAMCAAGSWADDEMERLRAKGGNVNDD